MQDCSRCKCKLSIDNFERNSTRCNKCRIQDRKYRQRIYQRKPTIAETNPELLEEWDYERNGALKPDKLTPGSMKKVWWICRKNPHHNWKTPIYNRTGRKYHGCSICSNNLICPLDMCNSIGKVLDECGDLKYFNLFEEFACKEDVYKYTPSSGKKIYWKCKKNPHHRWEAKICHRTGKEASGCPICSNTIICPIDMCNSIGRVLDENGNLKYADLIEEFAYRGDIYKYTPSSGKKIYWKCRKDSHHKWMASIEQRSRRDKTGCPICSNNIICPMDMCNSVGGVLDENGNLKYASLFDEFVCKEDMYKFTPSSDKKVAWRCRTDSRHKWEASMTSRTKRNACGCPICCESKGEKAVSGILHSHNIEFDTQIQKSMIVTNYPKTRRLRFDFFGKITDIKFAIEFDGKQHFDPESHYSKKENYGDSKIRDWLKTQWCTENGIKLLRIHYSDLGDIEKIVTKFVTDIECAEILTLSSNPNGDYEFMLGDTPPEI